MRHNVQYTKKTLKKEIFIAVMVAHCVLLMLVIISQKGDFEHEKFLINTNSLGSTVVFMPLHKKVALQQPSNVMQNSSQSRRVITHEAYQKALASAQKKRKPAVVPKKVTPKKSVPVPQPTKKVTTQAEKASTTIKSEKLMPVVEKKKIEAVKKVVTPEPKKVAEKSVDKKKVIEKPVEKAVKKEIMAPVKKEIATEKKIEPAPAEIAQKVQPVEHVASVQSEPITQDVVQAVPAVQPDQESIESDDGDDSTEDIDLSNVSFVGRHDLEKYEIQEKIKAEITKHWKFPFGVSKTTSCELGVTVGVDGKALLVMIKKGSGVLVYDMSAKAAAYQSRFPKEMYGKEFTIVLGC